MVLGWFKKKDIIRTNDDQNKQLDKSNTQKKQFDRMIGLSESIFKKAKEHKINEGYKHPILNYIKLLGLNLQTSYITNLLYEDDHGAEKNFPDITPWLVFFDLSANLTSDGRKMFDLLIKKDRDVVVDLVEDLVLPWAWHVGRYVDSISSIGLSRPWGEWIEDTSNHSLNIVLPMGVCFVEGGNHSITSGILNGKGKLKVENAYDMSIIYEYVYTDGLHYKRKEDDSIISEVKYVEFAAIFEIGRKMMKLGISR
ncbi:DUF6710 family protein [Paenibacillus agricola]|uniref:Uncharacterized protein n=1 Tax=Paenibacillus agricola TaxID=2716264 RepID=A0ABX0JDT9_9BACL|nr:DUF6710 family protein [Paenibacillus agricola]NHN34687.1 hypothetical protein [Paenibacillus agricola]